MDLFEDFNLVKQLNYALEDLGFKKPTPIQKEAFSAVRSGKDLVGIAQTGTGKTLAYMLPLLQDLKYSRELHPRILIIVPTRELVVQVVDQINDYTKYQNVRINGVYGGVNINTHKQEIVQGSDIVVATPGRLYDLILSGALKTKAIKKLVIDEVDVLLDLGFRTQLTNIFELLPQKRQSIMFSATMTQDVEKLIDDYFISPSKITIAVSGTPLENIDQSAFHVPNFYTKVNLLKFLIKDKEVFEKVLIFVANKKNADRLFESLEEEFGSDTSVIHSNKTQNYRLRSIEEFDSGAHRILITTDVMSRGLDLHKISHVINFEVPYFPENYLHRIGRTGRAEHKGTAIMFYTDKEIDLKESIEDLMDMKISLNDIPENVEISKQLTPEEKPRIVEYENPIKDTKNFEVGPSFHEKKDKNKKVNLGGTYRTELKKKYKKPKTRGDKNYNKKKRK